jgi:GNAT superfamily N-acetyltransferase
LGELTATDLSPPAPIGAGHEIDDFESGEPSLDEWLKKRALKSHASGAARCFVLCARAAVVGYYRLSAGALSHEVAPKPMRRNMPDPLPILLLGRLAIDKRYHNQGLGSALLRDAMMRAVAVANTAGVFAILIHALSPAAKQFYLSRGFVPSPLQPMTLMMTIKTMREILTE